MTHSRDLPDNETPECDPRRARLFALGRQQQRAEHSVAMLNRHQQSDVSTEALEAVRERAVASFARPARSASI